MKKIYVATMLLALLLCAIALCACSTEKYCTVSFDTMQGSQVDDIQVKKGNSIKLDASLEPTREGYAFKGWQYGNGEKFNLSDKISQDITLYAVWEVKRFDVIVNANIDNAGEIKSYKADDNMDTSGNYEFDTLITVEVEKVYKGYDFMGWYMGEQLCSNDTSYNFRLPAKDTEMTAKFKVQDIFADYKFTSNEDQLTITAYIGQDTVVYVPQGTDAIGKDAFAWQNNSNVASSVAMYITDIILPQGVVSIGESAFYGCSSLRNITIPSSVVSIGAYAFDSCKKLERVNIPYGVSAIENGTFYNCNALTEVIIPSSVVSIGTNAFYICHALSTIKIPSSVQTIKSNAFYLCGSSSAPLVIKCEATTQPSGWANKWYAMGGSVEWGVI